ncbi:MAG: iron-sulfur cluster assembly scaffold protein [Terriglobales bacterium]|jgi:nitrogen fixation NifU-like protein
MYHPKLLDHFEHPRNVGEIPDPDASVTVENPACGDVMVLTLKRAGERITDVRYRTKGCVAAIACGSRLTEMLVGRDIGEARNLDRQQLVDSLGGLTTETTHASHLAFDALSAALKQLK